MDIRPVYIAVGMTELIKNSENSSAIEFDSIELSRNAATLKIW